MGKPPQADVDEFKAKCSELRRLALLKELSNPVSFALENSWTTPLKSVKQHFLEHTTLRTVKVPLSQPCFDHFLPCFRGYDEAGLLASSMPQQKSAAKRRQRLLIAPLKPPSYDARFPTARSV